MDAIYVTEFDADGERWFAITLRTDEVPEVSERLQRGGHRGTGYCWEAFVVGAIEAAGAELSWADELEFDWPRC
jgi:hypothetical protein